MKKTLLKNLFSGIIVIFFAVSAVLYSRIISAGILKGINLCVKNLIPSIFFLMFISIFILKILNFKKPGKSFLFVAVFLSLFGGYPTGAKLIENLFNEKSINEDQAKRMIYFCFGAGPAFAISMVGTQFLNNTFIGILIFGSLTVSSLILGIFLFKTPGSKNKKFYAEKTAVSKNSFSQNLISACSDAAEAVLNICALVIIFSAILEILRHFGITNIFIYALLEVTSACKEAALLKAGPEFFAFALGFGGLCAHFQALALLKKVKISYFKFFMCRVLHALMASSFVFLFLKIFKKETEVFFTAIKEAPKISCDSTVYGSLALVILMVFFLESLHLKRGKPQI